MSPLFEDHAVAGATPHAIVVRSSVAIGTGAVISWSSLAVNNGNPSAPWSPGDPTRLYAREPGLYLVTLWGQFSTASTLGRRKMEIVPSVGDSVFHSIEGHDITLGVYVATPLQLAAGDYVQGVASDPDGQAALTFAGQMWLTWRGT